MLNDNVSSELVTQVLMKHQGNNLLEFVPQNGKIRQYYISFGIDEQSSQKHDPTSRSI